MVTIGVRELRQNASRYLRKVEQGEIFEVTDHGRPVARLVPIKAKDRLEELISQGRLVPPNNEGDLLDEDAVPPLPGRPLPSELLAQLRQDER